MSERLRYTDHTKPVSNEPPRVDIILVKQRADNHPWVEEALASIEAQTYPNLGLVEVDNYTDRSLSIGAAWNLAVQASEAELVLFVGDDDALSVDLTSSLVEHFHHLRQSAPNVVHITSNCTLLDELSGKSAMANVQHTGMFLRQYLIDHPFDETLTKHVGIAAVQAINAEAQALDQPLTMGIRHHYGYIWRQHTFMTNGRPILLK